MTWFRALALGMTLGIAPLASVAAAQEHGLEQVLVESASTPAQHEALAKHYRRRAEASKADAASHRAMAKSYSGTKAATAKAMSDHCTKLASLSDDEAAQYEALAAEHEAAAKK